jgi:hypothetical protein
MPNDSATQRLLFPEVFGKPVVAQFDEREGSSDGGALLLKVADRHYGLVGSLACCLRDKRQAGKLDHCLRELVGQRVFAIACGYPDANDAARLGEDPIHKLLLDRDPVEGLGLASQPTLSRFENRVGVRELYRLGEFLADSVLRCHAKRLRRRAHQVTLDLDPTDDPTHGVQQLSSRDAAGRPNIFMEKSATRHGSGHAGAASLSKPRSSARPAKTPKIIPVLSSPT